MTALRVAHAPQAAAQASIPVTTLALGGTSVLMLLHAAVAEPKAAALLREFLKVRMIAPILDYLDADRPELRASMIAGQVFGFGITHYLLNLDDMTATPGELTEVLGQQ